jgi:hypothetical protein
MPDQNLVATIVVYGRIIAVLRLPAGLLLLWDVFGHRCRLVPSEAKEQDIEQELADLPGIKFVELDWFVERVAADFGHPS